MTGDVVPDRYILIMRRNKMTHTICDLGSLEDIFKTINITLRGDDYDKAQDLLQESCPCYVAEWIERTHK